MASPFRNYAEFDPSILPHVVCGAIQPCQWQDVSTHVMMVDAYRGPLFLNQHEMEKPPFVQVWGLYDEDDELHGYIFQYGGQRVTWSTNFLLVQSPSLNRQFSLDDKLTTGNLSRVASLPHFSVFKYDLGATLIAKKGLGFMALALDKPLKEKQ